MSSAKLNSNRVKVNGRMSKSKVVAPRNPKLVRNDVEEEKQTPSAYMAEMSLTTDERFKQTYEMRIPQIIELLDMSETTHQKFTTLDIEMTLFQPFPSEIVFQNYEPFETYTVPLNLRNNDKVARLVKITQTDSPYFNIISPADVGHKVAPGMDTVFLIKFTPDEKRDYNHELICITEREKFIVPVRAVGARAILDFPDEVNFQTCPVKYMSTKTLLVRNVGNKCAKFKLLTDSPFKASPDTCVLGIAESVQVDIIFEPLKTGDFESNMVISYDTGENIYVTLYGISSDVNVRLDKNSLKLENTYITSASQRSISIVNRSDIMVHFQWKPLATLVEEQQQKQRFYQELSYREEEQKESFIEECIADPTLRDKFSLVTRSFMNRMKVAEGEKMLYNDDIISIDPVEGDIWPNSHADINIVFKPDEAKSYARTVYCDVSGRESRLPLRIRGDGIGSKIKFSFDTLDIENVFVNSEHSYEVIMKNVGDIDAVFSLVQSESLVGQQFEFSPSQGIIVPGGYQAIQIHFASPYLGEFNEEFVWIVEGSSEKFKFSVRGCIMGPTFHFDTPKLNFNTVSYGFTHVAACRLINTSLIPMTFYLRVPSDGTGHLASSIAGSFLSDAYIDESYLHQPPIEFEIYPNTGTIGPQSEIEIQVNLTSLTEQSYETYLVVDVEAVGKEILSLPISARSIVPEICLETPLIDYGRCFIRYPYEKIVVLKNETDLPAKYELLPQITEDRPMIRYSTHYVKGIIQPQSIIEIPLQITVHGIDRLTTNAYFMTYGCSDMPLEVQITCVGEGPVIHVSTFEIDYGAIPVLEDVTRQIVISNESLIPAEFICDMVRPHSLFSVEPERGVLAAERSATLIVKAKLDDCLRFQDKLRISVTDGQLHTVLLSGQGTGTTIVTEPQMTPSIDIGATFSNLVYTRRFRLSNHGRRLQQIFWSTEGFPLTRSKRKQEYNKDDVKYQKMPPPPPPQKPVFKLRPDRMSLAPGQSQEVILEGFSEKCQQVRERMICHAIVGNNTGKEKIMKVDIIADFIEPLVRFSERKISFFVMKHPHTELVKEVKELLLGNVSRLPLKMNLGTQYPFQILVDGQVKETPHLDLYLHVNESVPLGIQFDPDYKMDRYCRTARANLQISYQDHPNTDFIELTGDVFYPNLHFESDVVDFGCVLNDTEHLKNITVTNTSPLKVVFKWTFQDNSINFEGKEDDEGLGKDISDGEDDSGSKRMTQPYPHNISQGKPFDSAERPSTSPAISHLPLQMRPRTAPESSSINSQTSVLPWMPKESLKDNIGIQEVFDVLPLFGELEPGETQQFQFTFYGHSHSMAEAVAVCSVYGGPDYRILLKGQASLLQYGFNTTQIDLGRQLYDHVVTSEIILFNRGKVNFDFTVLNTDRGTVPLPSGITVHPSQGVVEAQQSLTLMIRFIPGYPEPFHKQFHIRVGHFEPEVITLTGEGIFPRISFDLPRDVEDPRYCKYADRANRSKSQQPFAVDKAHATGSHFLENMIMSTDRDLQEEVDRLQVTDFASELMNKDHDIQRTFVHTTSTSGMKKLKPRAQLSDYVLDFGFVNYGSVKTSSCLLTNPSFLPISFTADKQGLVSTGFSIEFDKIKDLPEGESIDFFVSFDPKAGNLSLGPVEVVLPIKISSGPNIGLKLKGVVTMPDIQLSCDAIDFDAVVCGQCKVVTIQMFNYTQVRCQWSAAIYKESKGKSRREQIHKRKKEPRFQKDARAFEMMPPSGTLFPGQRVNVQVKFMPTEEEVYSKKLVVTMLQSTYKHFLTCKGRGVEPRIEFDKLMVNFGPVLPHSNGDEQEVVVKNPCSFPTEFYCLEFDKNFLEEEKILRAMKGYDEYNTILLPPREAGSELPKELIEAYTEMSQKKNEKNSHTQPSENEIPEKNENEDETENQDGNEAEKILDETASEEDMASEHDVDSDYGVGELEITPISAAIARHLGIDLSAEGKAARNRRGIALIVHGAPLSGKTATASSLAEKYNIALLTVDDIVKEAISYGNSPAAYRIRELSIIAARNAAAAAENEGGAQPGGSSEAVATYSTGHQGNPLSMAPSTSGGIHGSFRESRKAATQPAMKQHKPSHMSPPSSPPVGPPPPRKLSIENASGNGEFYSCVLPDELLVEIIAEKLQSSECQMGVVFDGLESMFTANMTSCTNTVLRAINNRKYIFAVTLKLSKERLKVIDDKKKAEKAKKDKEEEEAEKIRLEEMSEDEYEALPEEEKMAIDRKRLEEKKRRMKKKETEEQKERELREERLAEEKRIEEEKAKSNKKRAPPSQGGNRKGHEKDVKERKHDKSIDRLTVTRETTLAKEKPLEQYLSRTGTLGNQSDRSESIDEFDKRKMALSRAGKREGPTSATCMAQIEEATKPSEEEIAEKELNLRFQAFDLCYRDITTLFEAWDRTTGSIYISESEKSELEQDVAPVQPTKKGQVGHKKGEKEREKEKEREREREKEKSKEVPGSPTSAMSTDHPEHSTDEDEAAKAKSQIGVPNIVLQTVSPQQSMIGAVLREQILPTFNEVQDGLGLGPSGPPVPPSAIFSVVPYPRRRKPNAVNEFGASYVFVASSADDPNALREETTQKTPEAEIEKPSDKKDHRNRRSRDKLQSGNKRGRQSMITNPGQTAASPPLVSPMADDDKSTNESGINTIAAELIRHRWVVPAEGEVKLKIRFSSPEAGRYDQTLNFELVGTRRRYQLFCRGVCCFPTISKEPRIVFPHRKKCRKPDEIVHKKYILSNRTFEFGPLLAGKNRDRYREGRYPENMEQLCISNTSQMDAEISFCYQADTNGGTFLMEPSSMSLKPNESQILNIWAYPKTPGFFEDVIVGCIKENPEPVVFKLSCHGVRPELEFDKRIIQFDRVLLYRTETRTVFLRNSTLLPIAWKLSGMDNLGDDFSVPVDNGIIDPRTEFALHMDFRAIRPTTVKRIVRLEVSDAANIMGLTHAENIQVHAEAYDVALDMSFPKGADGGLDFGVLRVFDEAKQSLSLKNKGRYEIGFNFAFEPTESCKNPEELFTVVPNKGTLIPSDRQTQVQVIFRSKDEVIVKDEPILKCQIIEPALSDPGEVIAGIPVKISVRSVYSKYSIFPVQDINFGAILVNTRKTKTITIENKGEFDFKYSIAKMQNNGITGNKVKINNIPSKRSREGSASGKSLMFGVQSQLKQKRTDSVKGADGSGTLAVNNANAAIATGASSIRLQLGIFAIFPASGTVLPGASAQVTVDMFSETSTVSDEDIAIDITERSPNDCSGGIEYKLMGETCLPSICTLQQNVASIFEEHRIVSNLNVFRYHSHDLEPGCGVFGEEESKFVFYNVIVGHKAKARIKISNPNKVVCDVVFTIKPVSNRPSARWTDVYEIEPQRAAIQPHSYSYVTITFRPSSMQSYSAVFEAAVDGLPNAIAKGRNLIFDVQGDGNLPRISILKPISVTNKGNPLLLFNRLLTSRSQSLPLVLKNDGTLPCRLNITLIDPEGCYTVSKEANRVTRESNGMDSPNDLPELLLECTASKPSTTSLFFKSGEVVDFIVEFTPTEVKRIAAELRLSVVDNPFEDAVVKLLGEGFEEEVTLDNIHGGMQDVTFADIEDENYTVPRNNHIKFGDCSVLSSSCQSFTLTNRAEADVIRFTWESPPQLTFSPCSGHLLPNCAKDIKVTFQSPEPTILEAVNVPCKISKIQLAKKVAKAGGWDDRMKTVRWVDAQTESNQPKTDDDEKLTRTATDPVVTPRPAKRKVVDTEPEPSFNALPGTATEIGIMVSALADYAKYELSTNNIFFKDTLMFQSRMFSFQVRNVGDVEFSYNWNIESGWTRDPTVINQQQPDEKARDVQSAQVKSAKHGRDASKSGKQSVPPQPKGANAFRQMLRKPPSPVDRARQTTAPPDKITASRIASACDGRPATAMALAYEAGSVLDEPSGNDVLPFSIEPVCGSIKAHEEATFTVRFSPLDTRQYGGTLIADIPNLEPGLDQPALLLFGRSLLPWCHFELEESDYIATRRNPELKGPDGSPPGCTLDPNTKVIEFQSCGIRTKATRRFYIMNPTNTTYSFSWTNEDSHGPNTSPSDSPFNCLVTKGVIEAGKKTEIVFEYLPESMELQESFWRFYIQEQNVSASFLLVGVATDPQVSLDKSHLNFKELLIGNKGVQTLNLINDEDKRFQFSIDKESLYAPGRVAHLAVIPLSGTIEAKSKLPITVEFTPENAQEVNFNLICKVKKKTTPLMVNIKAEGFKVASKLTCEDSQGNEIDLASSGANLINLGEVEVNEKVVRQLFIENTGKFNIDFSWHITQSKKPKGLKDAWTKGDPPISVVPDNGTIESNNRMKCQLSFCPPCDMLLRGCELMLNIVNGSKYRLEIAGSGVTPSLEFSFKSYDFGPCFIHRPGLPVPKATLTIENKDSKEIGIECLFKDKPYLEVMSEPGILAPGGKLEAEIYFYPRDLKRYHAKIPFEINGLSTMFVDITGQGTEMKVEVVNPMDKKVSLGALRIGQKFQRAVQIFNNSLASIEFTVAITPSLPHLQQGNILTISPLSSICLKPKEVTDISVSFMPKTRIPQFSEEVILECAGISQPLFVLSGCCHGLDIRLDSDAIPFGSVTIGSSSSRKLIMHNNGDVGAGFCWNIEKFKPDFVISPVKGYIAAGMEVTFDITFTPTIVNQDIRSDGLRCAIEGGRPLKLVLTGSCISQIPMKETINFQTHVRNRDVKSLTIHNKTNQQWLLRPVMDGEYWSGADTISIDPQQSKNYEITYRPLTMTHDNKKHTGTVFFALPDGSGLLYTLSGSADAPKPAGNIQLEVPCKMPYTEVLQVTNWLRKSQRFRVTIEMLKPEKPDPSITLKGLEYADVPGFSKKDYKLNFYAHKEGTFSAKVTFKNEQTLEYQFYFVQFKATTPGVISVIDLSTPVRQSNSDMITINNPLQTPVNFQLNCNVQEVSFPPQRTVPPQSEQQITFEYLPLKTGEVTARLSLQSSELGLYLYDLHLTATPANPERPVHFVTNLGMSQVQTCRFINYARSKAEYSCKIDSSEFLVDRSVTAASAASGGSEVGVDVTFEPTKLGDCKSTLTIASNSGGEYVFPLIGHCLAPKPQGPYTIKAGGMTTIPFKNVFPQTTSFVFMVDNPSFTVKSGETIRGKKTHSITVSFEGNQGDSKAVRMGRLVISCVRSAGTANNLTWTFYLKGITA